MNLESLYCKVCDKRFSGVESYQQHQASVKHAKKMEEQIMLGENGFSSCFFSCEICQIQVSGATNWQAHLAGSQHSKKIRRKELLEEGQATALKDTDGLVTESLLNETNMDQNAYKFCQLCNSFFSGPESAISHYNGIKHKRNLKRQNLLASESCSSVRATLSPEQNTSDSNETAESDNAKAMNFCSLCQVNFSGPETARDHYSGSKHSKNLKKKELVCSPQVFSSSTAVNSQMQPSFEPKEGKSNIEALESMLSDVKIHHSKDDSNFEKAVQ